MNREHDYERFVQDLAATAETLQGKLSTAMIEGYYEALEDLPIATVLTALRAARATAKWFLRPGELRALVGQDREALRAKKRVQFRNAIRHGSPNRAVSFGDAAAHAVIEAFGGWREVVMWPVLFEPDALEFRINEYERLYMEALANPRPDTPAVLNAEMLAWNPLVQIGETGMPEAGAKALTEGKPEPLQEIPAGEFKALVDGLLAKSSAVAVPERRHRLPPAPMEKREVTDEEKKAFEARRSEAAQKAMRDLDVTEADMERARKGDTGPAQAEQGDRQTLATRGRTR